jgi:hypothetical protein
VDVCSKWLDRDWLTRVDIELDRHGHKRTGPPVPVKLWSVSAVLRLPTDRGEVWYKAVPPLFAHEGRVMALVAEIAPSVVPTVLGHGNGWLLTAEMPQGADPAIGHPLDSVVHVQHATIGRDGQVLSLGCPDRTPATMLPTMEGLVQSTDLLGTARAGALAAALPALSAVIDRVNRLSIPPTLVHGDVNGENSRWSGRGWVHVDWTDACLAHPFVELAQPLVNAGPVERRGIESAFGAAWADYVPAAEVREALALSPVLGAIHQAGTYFSIVQSVGPADDHPQMLKFWVDRLVKAASLGSRSVRGDCPDQPGRH